MARSIDFLNEDPNFTIFYFLAEIYGLLCNVGGKTLISSWRTTFPFKHLILFMSDLKFAPPYTVHDSHTQYFL